MKKTNLLIGLFCLSLTATPLALYANTHTQESPGAYLKASTITADVKSKLLADPDVKSMKISVTTMGSAVTLTGHVDTVMQKEKAVAIAKSVDGVTTVHDELKLTVKSH